MIENEPPPPPGAALRLTRELDDVRLSRAGAPVDPLSCRVYKAGERSVPMARRRVDELALLDLRAMVEPRFPIAYYQLVDLSCHGSCESPY